MHLCQERNCGTRYGAYKRPGGLRAKNAEANRLTSVLKLVRDSPSHAYAMMWGALSMTYDQYDKVLTETSIEDSAQRLRRNTGYRPKDVFNVIEFLEQDLPKVIEGFSIEIVSADELGQRRSG
jgi:hypothetical protein